MECIRTGFCNCIYTSPGKTSLTDIIRRYYYLNFFNRFKRNRVGTSLSAIRSTRRKTKHIIVCNTINLE